MTAWQAWYRIEPWGELREDLRAGQVAAAAGNAGRLAAKGAGAKIRGEPFEADDFFRTLRAAKLPSAEELARKLKLWAV